MFNVAKQIFASAFALSIHEVCACHTLVPSAVISLFAVTIVNLVVGPIGHLQLLKAGGCLFGIFVGVIFFIAFSDTVFRNYRRHRLGRRI